MKRIFTVSLSLLIAAAAFGQDRYDELLLSTEQYGGSARTMAMGNAFTALGGDMGSLSINPASSGVFRCSQISVTPAVGFRSATSTYLGSEVKSSASTFTVPNTGFVFTFDTGRMSGLLNFNFGLTLSRKADFNTVTRVAGSTSGSSYVASLASELAASGITYDRIDMDAGARPFDNVSSAYWPHILMYNAFLIDLDGDFPSDDAAYIPNTYSRDNLHRLRIPGELNQDLYRRTRGGIDEFSLNFGGNVSDILYFGVNVNLESVNYIVEESMSEFSSEPGRFDTGFDEALANYWRQTTGLGINAKFGLIVTPVTGLRIGATFTTPTAYSLTDTWDHTVYSYFDGSNPLYQDWKRETPPGVYDWNTTSPLRFSIGAAYVFGKGGLVSFDYERVNYSRISNEFNASNIFRAGAEGRIADFISLRAGYAHYSSPEEGGSATRLVSGGLGFNLNSSFGIDVAYQHMLQSSGTFSLYNNYTDIYEGSVTAPTGTEVRSGGRVSVSLNWKF